MSTSIQVDAKKLLEDDGEANKLLKTLLENDMLFGFNSNFPRIFRELKANYGSYRALREVRRPAT